MWWKKAAVRVSWKVEEGRGGERGESEEKNKKKGW